MPRGWAPPTQSHAQPQAQTYSHPLIHQTASGGILSSLQEEPGTQGVDWGYNQEAVPADQQQEQVTPATPQYVSSLAPMKVLVN
jgi:hypothetical protein